MGTLEQYPIHSIVDSSNENKQNSGEYISLVVRVGNRIFIHTDKGTTYQGTVESGTELRLEKNVFLSSLGKLRQMEYIGGLSMYCLVEDTGKLFEYDLSYEPGKPPVEMVLMTDFQPTPTHRDPIPEKRKIPLPIESIAIVKNEIQAKIMIAIARDGSIWSWQPLGPNDPEGITFYKYDSFTMMSTKIKSLQTGAWSQFVDDNGTVWVWGMNAYRYFNHVYSRDIFDTFVSYENEQNKNYEKETPQFWDSYSETLEERRLKTQNDFDILLNEIRKITDSTPFKLDNTDIPGGQLTNVALRDEIAAGINKTTGEIYILKIPENNSRVYLNTTDISREELPVEFTKLSRGIKSTHSSSDKMDTTEISVSFKELYIGTRLFFALDTRGKIHVWKLPKKQQPMAISFSSIQRSIDDIKMISTKELELPKERDYYEIDDDTLPSFGKLYYSYNELYSELLAVSSDSTRLFVIREGWFEPWPVELKMSFIQLPSGTV